MIPSLLCEERAPSIAKAYVYLLRSKTSGRFYTGWTTNLERRFEEHNSGMSHYTKTRGPWDLIGYETFPTIVEAKKRERAFKHNPRMLSFFKKRALQSFFRNSGENGMIPSPLFPPKAESAFGANKEVMG